MAIAKHLICVLDFSLKLSGIENAFAAHLLPADANLLDCTCSSGSRVRARRFRHAN
jgi:hypothetical protein